MECPVHSNAEVVGYCNVCGVFGCSECLTLHEGHLLCAKHYRPIAKKLEENKKHEAILKKHPKLRLIVNYRSDKDTPARSLSGACFSLNLKEEAFHLDLVDESGALSGESVAVAYSEITSVLLVKSFDGNFDKNVHYDAWVPEGEELVIKFNDGEVVHGRALRPYNPSVPRFYIVPTAAESNTISILVERTATEAIYKAEEYKEKQAQERKVAQKAGAPTDMSQEESVGDFYFQMRNYAAAIAQYRLAAGKNLQNQRPRKKMLAAQYNMGVDHIKRREYDKALAMMESLLKTNPENERVQKKIKQLRKIIEKSGRPRA